MSFKEVTALRKSGKLQLALEMAKADFSAMPNKWSASSLFWVYFYITKIDDFLGLSPWFVGRELLSLSLYLQDDEVILKSLPLVMTRLAGECTRGLKSALTVPEDELQFLKEAKSRFPEDVFVVRALAWAYNRSGQSAAAITLFRDILRKKNDAYLWGELYDFVRDDEIREAALCKALLLQSKPEFTGNLRLKLACVLIRKGDYAGAASELAIYEDTYRKNKWALADEYRKIMKFIPKGTMPIVRDKKYYSKSAASVEEFIFPDVRKVTYIPMALSGRKSRNGKKSGMNVVLVDMKGRVLLAPLAPLKVSLDDYMRYSFILQVVNKRIISCVKSEELPAWKKSVRIVSGSVVFKVDKNGSRYGMLDHCFIPPQIVSRMSQGVESVSFVAFQKDGKWKATYLL